MLLLSLVGALGATSTFADAITPTDTITLNESQRTWAEGFQFVSGTLILCNGTPRNFLSGPCTDGAKDIIIFDNATHEAIFLSNSADGGGDPADVPFAGHLNLINPRYVFEPTAVNSGGSFLWAPGPNDPGYFGTGNTWTISDAPTSTSAEPSTIVLLATVLIVVVKLAYRTPHELNHRRSPIQ